MTTQQTKVDWSRPIEAVHEDGRVFEAVSAGSGRASWNSDDRHFYEPAVMDDGRTYWHEWRIRNVGEPLQKMQQLRPGEPGYWEQQREQFAKNAKNPSPELTARMVAFVRVVANCTPTEGSEVDRLIVENARAFMAELDPVDGDRNEAERIAYDMEGALPRDLVEAGIKAGRKMEADERNAAIKRKWDDAHGSGAIAGRALAEAGK